MVCTDPKPGAQGVRRATGRCGVTEIASGKTMTVQSDPADELAIRIVFLYCVADQFNIIGFTKDCI